MLASLPLLGATMYVIYLPKEQREDVETMKIVGVLYEDQRSDSKWAVGFNLIFCLRRLFFVVVIFTLEDHSGYQIMLINFMNLMAAMYIIGVEPNKEAH